MDVKRVLLVEPRGFCAGVESAIKALAWMVLLYGPPVYCFHEIVHNEAVVARFRRLGVTFVDGLEHVPPGVPLMLSAHGTSPAVLAAAIARDTVVIDAVCPLVAKVHHEIDRRAAAGYTIVYVGHAGHDEAVAAEARAPQSFRRVASAEDADALELGGAPIALLAQTTLAHEEWSEVEAAVQRRVGPVWTPPVEDICYATTNRQAAVRAVARRCDAVVVVGSANSSNTEALVRTARTEGCPAAVRVDRPEELPPWLRGTVGITAGASAPEASVARIVAALAPRDGVERCEIRAESAYLPLPTGLRRIMQQQIDSGRLPAGLMALTDERSTDAERLMAYAESQGVGPGRHD